MAHYRPCISTYGRNMLGAYSLWWAVRCIVIGPILRRISRRYHVGNASVLRSGFAGLFLH